MAEYGKTVLINFGTNVKNFFAALWETIKSGGSQAFQFDWTPLAKGFQEAAAVYRPVLNREMSGAEKDVDARIASLNAQVEKEQNAYLKRREKKENEANAKRIAEARDNAEEMMTIAQQMYASIIGESADAAGQIAGIPEPSGGGSSSDGKSQIVGLQDIFKRIQESAAGDDAASATAKATAQTATNTKFIADTIADTLRINTEALAEAKANKESVANRQAQNNSKIAEADISGEQNAAFMALQKRIDDRIQVLRDVQAAKENATASVANVAGFIGNAFSALTKGSFGGSQLSQLSKAQLDEQKKTTDAAVGTKSISEKMLSQLIQFNSKTFGGTV
jgi:hypothetical protein